MTDTSPLSVMLLAMNEAESFGVFAGPEIPGLDRVVDLDALLPGEGIEAEGPGREVTESSARRRPSDGVRSSSVQHLSLRSPA